MGDKTIGFLAGGRAALAFAVDALVSGPVSSMP